MTPDKRRKVEMWMGLECTLNRVGDRFVDQLALSGHDQRVADDLQLFSTLGAKRIRYPVLWEKHAPIDLQHFDWTLSDIALAEMQALRLSPIAGLIHHGSGPRYSSLLDPEFPEKLATYAGAVARRYPWIDAYTPVNEPLTTARFSGLYGFWYPHQRSDATFFRMLYHELRGTVLAMEAIRTINPSAQLVQTEDLGITQGTPQLRYQVDFENHRKWLTFDLLSGLVDESHPLFSYLTDCGKLSSDEILWFRAHRCRPDVLGINHYPLSNRFLDHRLELYPTEMRGHNGRESYADVGAVDSGLATPPLPSDIIAATWDRYRLPIAITEVHISGPREAQMRWLKEIWSTAQSALDEGVDIRAITAWSLLGSYGWSSLCTGEPGAERYESGIFDNRSKKPRPTALAEMIRGYARTGIYEHPLLERAGYWREPSRVKFAHPSTPLPSLAALREKPARPILIVGADTALGEGFVQACRDREIDHVPFKIGSYDFRNLVGVLSELDPWAVVDATCSIDAQHDTELAVDTVPSPWMIAHYAKTYGARFITFSSDQVFSGNQRYPYTESSAVEPISAQGQLHAEIERRVLATYAEALIVRTSSLFSTREQGSFLSAMMRALRSGHKLQAVDDVWTSPTYLPDCVFAALDLLIDDEKGIFHLANDGASSMSECAHMIADCLKADHSLIYDCSFTELRLATRGPSYCTLSSERRTGLLAPLKEVIPRYVADTLKQGMT